MRRIPLLLKRKSDDPIYGAEIVRVTIGGSPKRGFYCTFRGQRANVAFALETCFRALDEAQDDQIPFEPDNGNHPRRRALPRARK